MNFGRLIAGASLSALWSFVGNGAWAHPSAMVTGNFTSQPIGHFEFCKRNTSECTLRSRKTAPLPMSSEFLAQLREELGLLLHHGVHLALGFFQIVADSRECRVGQRAGGAARYPAPWPGSRRAVRGRCGNPWRRWRKELGGGRRCAWEKFRPRRAWQSVATGGSDRGAAGTARSGHAIDTAVA